MKPVALLAASALLLTAGASQGQTQIQTQTIGGCKIEPNAQCAKADLRGAKLVNKRLSGANLSGANLDKADLDGSDLSKADLSNSTLRGASLLGTRTDGTNFAGADLSGATWTASRDAYGVAQPRTCAAGYIGSCK